jgi:dimethylargininase
LEAAGQLERILENDDLRVVPVKVRSVLHLKSACTYLGSNCVILSKGHFDTKILGDCERIVVPRGEEYAADCLAVNGTVLMARGYPKTRRLLETRGFFVKELDVSEFRKGDGAVTCLSIVW